MHDDAFDEGLCRLRSLLSREARARRPDFSPAYGDLAELDMDGLIAKVVDRQVLAEIVDDVLDLTRTSAAVFELDGAYALNALSSSWCRLLDESSRRLCETTENAEALTCGRWICRDACWNNGARRAIELGQPVDVEAPCGLRLHAVPVMASGEPAGAMTIVWGSPPLESAARAAVAELFQADAEAVERAARLYDPRPPFISDLAKDHLLTAARLLGSLVERAEAQHELQDSEARVRATFDQAAVGFALTTPQGRFIRVNDRLCEIVGYSQEELAGGGFPEITHPDDLAVDLANMQSLLAGETETFSREKRIVRKDASTVWVNLTVSLVRDQDGQPQYFIGVMEDIDQRKRTEVQLERITRLYVALSQVNEAIVRVKDPDKLFQAVCDIAVRAGGLRMAWIGAVEGGSVLPRAWAGHEAGYLDAVRLSTRAGEETGRGPTGTAVREKRPVISRDIRTDPDMAPWREEALARGFRSSASAPIVSGDEVVGVFNLYADEPDYFMADEVTLLEELASDLSFALGAIVGDRARRAAELGLQASRDRLEELVTERTAQLEQTIEELEEASKAKSLFLAAMSHELRTPLNSVLGFSGVLLQGLAGELNDEQRRQIEMIRVSGSHLLELINDVLDLSRIESGRIDVSLTTFEVEDVMSRTVQLMRAQATAKSLSLELDPIAPGLWLHSDRRMVEQILINLVGNAIKFTSSGEVRLSAQRNGSGTVLIRVADTGVGIPSDALERVFESFTQVPVSSDQAKPEGSGLGLALSMRFAETLGGTIKASSEVGRGSEFVVELPRDARRSEPDGDGESG